LEALTIILRIVQAQYAGGGIDRHHGTNCTRESCAYRLWTWPNAQATLQKPQISVTATIGSSTLDQKVPGSTPGGAIASAAVTYT
jgi:hypothetical protein